MLEIKGCARYCSRCGWSTQPGVLLGGIGAQHVYDNTMSKKECAGQGVVKLTAIVALDALNGGTKLCVNITNE